MNVGWLEVVLITLLISVVVSLVLARGRHWLEPGFWKVAAVITSSVMTITLVLLTVDTSRKISMGSKRVPSPSVINREIGYVYSPDRRAMVPTLGKEVGLFGKVWSEEEAEKLITKGKLVIQSRNCMDCHTLLGNGAYYAPDLTKAWLDPKWEKQLIPMTGANTKEEAMKAFLMNPDKYPTWVRRMPNLRLSEDEAVAVVAYLKWMSAIDTNGFPANFPEVKVSQ
ncbi:MAG: c-type cytochrome [Hydrogenobacter sp.]|uniref:Nitric oxide reductase, NorC subunit apoprotein n=1 Tax=Hydrogenobacter hydrogenophilus TaxID=35835 RepID=A0A285PAT6_9AQUI|nr:cytochrome c [Hydrogenobacter hydrogenophilus]SNZ16971.1 nitric oxide reductase, NorC subunit apoprotein [Hydrogenobacter hydrogenophilus]